LIQEFIKRGYGGLIESGFKDIQETSLRYGTHKPLSINRHYGRIINFSTDTAQVMSGQIAYGSSKASIEALTRSVAMKVTLSRAILKIRWFVMSTRCMKVWKTEPRHMDTIYKD